MLSKSLNAHDLEVPILIGAATRSRAAKRQYGSSPFWLGLPAFHAPGTARPRRSARSASAARACQLWPSRKVKAAHRRNSLRLMPSLVSRMSRSRVFLCDAVRPTVTRVRFSPMPGSIAHRPSRCAAARPNQRAFTASGLGGAALGVVVVPQKHVRQLADDALVLMRNSDVAKLTIAMAESNPALSEQLGRPLKTGWFVPGKIEVTPASGHSVLTIPVSGPNGSGTIYAEGRKGAGVWHLEMLQFGNEGSSQRLDLLVPDSAPTPTAPPQ